MSAISLQAILRAEPGATSAWQETHIANLMRALLGVTTSSSCRQWLSANYSPPSKVGAEILAITMETRREVSQKHPEYRIQLTSENYLSGHSQPSTLLFLTDGAAPIIDPFGYDGWELFFTMLETWQGELSELPAVVRSILGGGI